LSRKTVLKIVIAVVVIAAIIAVGRVLPIRQWLEAFKGYVAGLGALGYVLYALVYALCVVSFVPASILTLGAGAVFGVAKGSIVVIAGATLGATLAFLLARTVLRKSIEKKIAGNAKFRALDQAIAREGAKIVLLVRLAPVFPFTYTNYAFGLTGIPLGAYVAATFIGMIPATIAFVYLGFAAANIGKGRTIIFIVGGVVAVIASAFVGRVATQAIKNSGLRTEDED
jgi:uncharacterized membrane protein YdjX (TVP38/TMEM64 family)